MKTYKRAHTRTMQSQSVCLYVCEGIEITATLSANYYTIHNRQILVENVIEELEIIVYTV